MKQVNKRHPCCKEQFRSCKRNINPLYIPHLVPVGKRVQLVNQPVTTLNLTKVFFGIQPNNGVNADLKNIFEKKAIKTQAILADWICWSKRYLDPKKVRCPVPVPGFSRFFFPKNEGLGPGYPQPSHGTNGRVWGGLTLHEWLVAFLMVNVSRSNLTNMIFQLGWNHQPDLVVEFFFNGKCRSGNIYTWSHGCYGAQGQYFFREPLLWLYFFVEGK